MATRKGNELTVRTRYWGVRKDGSVCETDVCRPVKASCNTPPLEPGAYVVRYGAQSFELHIPSRLKDPCFGTNDSRRTWPAPTPDGEP